MMERERGILSILTSVECDYTKCRFLYFVWNNCIQYRRVLKGSFMLPARLLEIMQDSCPLRGLNQAESEFFGTTVRSSKPSRPQNDAIIRNISRLINKSNIRNFSNFPPQLSELIKQAEIILNNDRIRNNIFEDSLDAAVMRRNPWLVVRKVINMKSVKDLRADMDTGLLKAQEVNEDDVRKTFNLPFGFPDDPPIPAGPHTLLDSWVDKVLSKHTSSLLICPPSTFYRHSSIIKLTTQAVESCLSNNYFPARWAVGKASFIPKKGSSKVRMIVVQHPLGMVLQEKLFVKLEKKICELKATELKRQFAFTHQRGVHHAVYYFNKMVKSTAGRAFILIDLDISGAFDSVPWTVIRETLTIFGFDNEYIDMIMQFLHKFTIWIDYNCSFKGKKLEKGFPQGSKLGPALWTLITARFIPEIEELFRKYSGGFIVYADDVKIYLAGNSVFRVKDLINDIKNIVAKYGLILNESKTKVLIDERFSTNFQQIDGILAMKTEKIALLGFPYSFPDRHKLAFWAEYKEKAKGISAAVSPFFHTLNQKSRKVGNLIIRQCVLSVYAHCLPMVLDDLSIKEVIMKMWDIEGSIVNCIYRRGNSLKHTSPLQYTGLICIELIRSTLMSLIADKQFKNHKFVKEFFDKKTIKKWYSNKGLKYHPFTNISISDTMIDSDVTIMVKPLSRYFELRLIIRTTHASQRWSIPFPKGTSTFDILRIGISTVLHGFTSPTTILIITRDSSLTRCDGCLDIFQTPYVQQLYFFITDEPQYVFAKRFTLGWSTDVTLDPADICGNTTIRIKIDRIIDESLLDVWKKRITHSVLDFELWQQIWQCPVVFFLRRNALRFIFHYVDDPSTFCECSNSGTIHFICECPLTHSLRQSTSEEVQDYLLRSATIGKFFITPNFIICRGFVLYLSSLFKISLKHFKKPLIIPFV